MYIKWIVIDEIELELIKDKYGKTKCFNTKKDAIKYARSVTTRWTVIDIDY